jgi:CheY-like chemotaxis protein
MADTPIIAFTAQVIPGDDARAQDAGFARYFAKPVEPHDVLEDIQQRIGPPDSA